MPRVDRVVRAFGGPLLFSILVAAGCGSSDADPDPDGDGDPTVEEEISLLGPVVEVSAPPHSQGENPLPSAAHS